MLVFTSRLGGIEEIESGLRWDAAALSAEIGRRAQQLSRLGIARGGRVAILHGGSADFFADLLAAWSLGATAICLDPALTPSERDNVLAFARPDAILVGGREPIASPSSLPGLALGLARQSIQGRGKNEVRMGARVEPAHDESETDPALILFTSGSLRTLRKSGRRCSRAR